MALDLRNLSIRTVSGLVYAGLLIGAIICGPLASSILLSVFAVLAVWEIESNTVDPKQPGNWKTFWLFDSLILVVLLLANGIPLFLSSGIFVYACLLFLRFILQIFSGQKNPLKSISTVSLEQIYIGLPLLLFVLMTSVFQSHPWVMVCALSMIWINDSGAYIIGSMFGRHKMFPVLSPKKSWEGFFGGLLFNVGAAFLFFYCFKLDSYELIHSVWGWIYIGICVTLFATLGDLFESMLKRYLGIKDFGKAIPGHGGILDRIDSLLFVVPGVTLALYFAKLIS